MKGRVRNRCTDDRDRSDEEVRTYHDGDKTSVCAVRSYVFMWMTMGA